MLDIPASQAPWQAQTQAAQVVTTIICPICDAVYAPSLTQVSFLQASAEMLESAFMSMCHFCFRCRRPACPQCWDSVHSVCGDCVREAHLSFRAEAAPLDGLLFHPLQRQEHSQQEVAAALLTCVKPGRFLQTEMPVHTAIEPARTTEDFVPAPLPNLYTETEDAPGNVMPAPPMPEISQRVTEKVAAAQTEKADSGENDDEEVKPRPWAVVRVLHVIERVLTVVALFLLLAIIALVVVAQASAAANTLILQALHVDIRAEVAYLMHLVQQLGQ